MKKHTVPGTGVRLIKELLYTTGKWGGGENMLYRRAIVVKGSKTEHKLLSSLFLAVFVLSRGRHNTEHAASGLVVDWFGVVS